MNSPNYIPSFYFYKFAQDLSAPYTSLEAYQSGAIDANGNIIKPESSIDPLEYLVIKLKKIFAELPPGTTKAKLGDYMSTMQLFGEEAKTLGITDTEYKGLIEGYLALNVSPDLSYIELSEDMGAAGMATAATSPDYNTGSVSGFDPRIGSTVRREPVLKGLDSCEMFDVCPEEMRGFKSAKAWKHVPDSETKRYLQRYQRRNPKGHMAVRSIDPDSGKADIHWINLKPMSFMEQFGLENLDFLFEEASTEESGVIDSFTDTANDPEINVATLPNSKEKAKKDRKGFVRPKPNPAATHADRFREDINELVRLHGEATTQKREAQAHEYAARIAFHAHNYHALKDTPHLGDYMDKTHQQIISSASANDRGLKSGDILRAKRTDLGVEYETMDFKSKGANVAAGFPVAFLKDMLARNPEDLASWTRTTSGSRQSFVFPKIKVGGVENPEHAKSARERFESMRSAIEGIQDPNLMQQREAIKKKTEGKSTRTMVIRHPETGRFHFVTPKQVVPYISQKGGQADRAFREGHQRHNIIYRRDFSNPPKDSEVFEMEQGAQDTLLSHADPAHHELLKKLTDVHIKKT